MKPNERTNADESPRTGVWLIERLSASSLAACASVNGRTVEQLLKDNGYHGKTTT